MTRYTILKKRTPEGQTSTYLHRFRAERALGRPLPKGAVVHHADGTRSDSSPLVICQDEAYHKLLHVRMRVRDAGGDPNTDRICYTCKEVKRITQFPPSCAVRKAWYCSACMAVQARARRAKKRAA